MKRSFTEVTRFLGGQELLDKDLWGIVKPHIRRIQADDAVLIVDDTVEEKPSSDESDLITRKVASGNFRQLAFRSHRQPQR